MGRSIIILFILISAGAFASTSEKLDFRQVDSLTYQYYLNAEWEKLVGLGEEAIEQGIDYYYLRMRVGIGWYELGKYLFATEHFKKALKFNSPDLLATEYLYYCYLNSGKHALANRYLRKLKAPARNLADSLYNLPLFNIAFEAGPMFHSYSMNPIEKDLDGEQDIYGEISYPESGFYSNLTLGLVTGRFADVTASYTYLANNKKHLAMAGDSTILDEDVRQTQQQVFVQLPIHPGKGFRITPALHLLNLSYTSTRVSYNEEGQNYAFTKTSARQNEQIWHISAEKDFGLFSLGLSGALGNLNGEEQVQYGACISAYPMGDLSFWSKTGLLNHRNEGTDHLVFEQSAGFKAAEKLRGEVYVTVGPVVNYFNNNAFIIYNSGYEVKTTGGTRWTFYAGKGLALTLDYKFLQRKAPYLQYSLRETGYFEYETYPETKNYYITTHMILGGITWKL
jgi:tetratricopeptide (TPR) repeat protein